MAEKIKKTKEIQIINQGVNANSIDTFINKAIEMNATPETMEKLFDLHRKVKADFAREEFVKAMSKFQSVCPVIEKTKKVLNKDSTTTRYMYAPLESIVKQIQKPLAENGLSYKWEVTHETDFVNTRAIITHIYGHSESSEFKVPIAISQYMTAPQSYASALTFAKRYSLCNALGVSTGDEDTDATTVKTPKEPKSNKAKIIFYLRKLGKPTGTEEIVQSIKDTTNLDPMVSGNIPLIVERLQTLTKDEDTSIQ